MATTQPFENPAAAVNAGSVDSLAWVYDQVARCAYALKEAAPRLANDAACRRPLRVGKRR